MSKWWAKSVSPVVSARLVLPRPRRKGETNLSPFSARLPHHSCVHINQTWRDILVDSSDGCLIRAHLIRVPSLLPGTLQYCMYHHGWGSAVTLQQAKWLIVCSISLSHPRTFPEFSQRTRLVWVIKSQVYFHHFAEVGTRFMQTWILRGTVWG